MNLTTRALAALIRAGVQFRTSIDGNQPVFIVKEAAILTPRQVTEAYA